MCSTEFNEICVCPRCCCCFYFCATHHHHNRNPLLCNNNLPAITDRSNRSAGSGAPTKSANVCTDSIVVAALLQVSPNSIDYTQIEVTGRRRLSRLLFIVAILFCRRAVDLCCTTTTTTINIRDRLVNAFVFFFYLRCEKICVILIYFGSAHRHEREGIIFQRCAFCSPPAPSSAAVFVLWWLF